MYCHQKCYVTILKHQIKFRHILLDIKGNTIFSLQLYEAYMQKETRLCIKLHFFEREII